MNYQITFHNLWLFYVLAYVIAFPVQMWANQKRGAPFDDPEFLFKGKVIFPVAMIWLFGGLAITQFVPVKFGVFILFGLVLYTLGILIAALGLYSYAHHSGLVTTGIHRFSRNPGYVGWTLVMFGLCAIGWSNSIWSVLFLVYTLITPLYFHWTVLLEEKFLTEKYGESYRAYLKNSSRYFGIPR